MDRKELTNRLNRVQGQIESIKKSLAEEAPMDCIKTMQLIKAANNALKKFGEAFVSQHMDECLTNKPGKKEIEKDLREVINAAFTL